jgi:hypothetical protein
MLDRNRCEIIDGRFLIPDRRLLAFRRYIVRFYVVCFYIYVSVMIRAGGFLLPGCGSPGRSLIGHPLIRHGFIGHAFIGRSFPGSGLMGFLLMGHGLLLAGRGRRPAELGYPIEAGWSLAGASRRLGLGRCDAITGRGGWLAQAWLIVLDGDIAPGATVRLALLAGQRQLEILQPDQRRPGRTVVVVRRRRVPVREVLQALPKVGR